MKYRFVTENQGRMPVTHLCRLLGVSRSAYYHWQLSQNYPNPFNPTTTFEFDVPNATHVSLKVYNVLGQEVATLVNETKGAGRYRVEWKATGVASGMYWYRMQAGQFTQTRKLVLVR